MDVTRRSGRQAKARLGHTCSLDCGSWQPDSSAKSRGMRNETMSSRTATTSAVSNLSGRRASVASRRRRGHESRSAQKLLFSASERRCIQALGLTTKRFAMERSRNIGQAQESQARPVRRPRSSGTCLESDASRQLLNSKRPSMCRAARTGPRKAAFWLRGRLVTHRPKFAARSLYGYRRSRVWLRVPGLTSSPADEPGSLLGLRVSDGRPLAWCE